MKRGKGRRIAGVFFAIVGAVLLYSSCTAAGGASSAAAADLSQTVQLTGAQTVALFGQQIEVSYLTRPAGVDTYVSATMTYIATETISGITYYYSPVGQSFYGRSVVYYSMPYPSDLSISANSACMLNLKTAVDLSAVDYIDFAITQNTGSPSLLDITSVPYVGLGVNSIHTDFGDFEMLRADAPNTPGDAYAGYYNNSIGVPCTLIPVYGNYSSPRAGSIGWAKCSTFRNSENRIIIGIVAPLISQNYSYDGNNGAGEGGNDSSSSGDGLHDHSGIESRLDSIIERLDSIINEMQDSSSSSGDSDDDPDSLTGYDSEPDDFDYVAAWGGASPALDVPFISSNYTPGGGDGMQIVPVMTDATIQAPDINTDDMTGGISAIWDLFSRVLASLPIVSKLIAANLAVSLAVFFIFREGA